MSEEVTIIRPNSVIEVHKTLFEGLEVTRAIFHQAVDVPKGGGSTNSIYSKRADGTGKSALSGVTMKYNQDGLFCEYKGAAFVVPLANIIVCYI